MHHSVSENQLVCVLDSAKEHRISKQQHWSQRQRCLQCPCTVCQHLQHIFYHDLYLHFYLYTVKEKQPMAIKTCRCSYKDSNYSEEEKQKKKKVLNTYRITGLSFGLPPLLFLFLAFGTSKYFTFYCSTAVTVRNKIILTLFVSPQQSSCFAND